MPDTRKIPRAVWVHRQALLMDRERRLVENIGVRAASVVASKARGALIRSASHGLIHADQLRTQLQPLRPLLTSAMVAAHLKGVLRGQLAAGRAPAATSILLAIDGGLDFGPYSDAIAWMRRRADMSTNEVAALAERYSDQTARVLSKALDWAESPIRKAVAGIVQSGAHVKGAMASLREAFATAGIAPSSNNLLETLVRTQSQFAYSAGQAIHDAQPHIRAILWGYQFSATHDDRVRPTHWAMNGVTLRADDPWWDDHTPPCGYNCRCSRVQIMRDELNDPSVPEHVWEVPPTPLMIDGQLVHPVADEGFGTLPI